MIVFNRSAMRDVCVCNVKPVEEEERAEETQKKPTKKRPLQKKTPEVSICVAAAQF